MSYLLDTNICIALLKGKEKGLVSRIKTLNASDLKLCSVVKAELLFGARYSERVDANLNLLVEFFSAFESLSFDDEAAQYYGTIRSLLTKAGTPIGGNDLMIASIALNNNLTLITRNQKEFTRVTGLRVESW